MPRKKIVQDIVPSERRSIRKISIEHDTTEVDISKAPTPVTRTSRITEGTRSGKKYFISFIIIFICIGIIGIALSLSYSKAVVTITKKVANFTVDGTFTAKKDAPTGELSYQVASVTDSLTETVPATKGPLIQTKAKGVATIYNNHSATAQTLVAGTRLATTDGRIYRTTTTVSVPGKKTLPGAVSVNVVANLPGENYNFSIAEENGTLKLPGYKGTDKYAGFYAKFKTDITGGFSGNKLTIDSTLKKDKIAAMQSALKETLVSKLKSSVSSDSILYENSYNIEFSVPEPIMKDGNQAEIVVNGAIYGAIFNSDVLIKHVAGKEIKKFPSETYIIDGDRALTFKVSNTKDFSAKKGTPVIFTLKGPISITGVLDEDQLKRELLGIKLEQSNAVFAKHTSITNAYALITPFWLRSFPDSVSKISIEYKH